MPANIVLLLTCVQSDKVLGAITDFLRQRKIPCLAIDQHSVDEEQRNYMRLELQIKSGDTSLRQIESQFQQQVATPFAMHFVLFDISTAARMVIFVSRHDHVLLDLLHRYRNSGQIALVISNHNDLRGQVEAQGIAFHHIEFHRDCRSKAEQQIMQLLEGQVDVLVLARFMQILSADFVAQFSQRIINIHHSFLPAFKGADPYRQAYARGVKLIGATAHYVTEDLDEGPIIEQDATRVSHRFSVQDLKDVGKDLERNVLARALKWHLQRRILCFHGRCYVFYR